MKKFRDEHEINDRLSEQFSLLLKEIEEGCVKLTLSQKITALTAIDRHIERRLKKDNADDDTGSAVREAAAAFTANAAGERGKPRRVANGKAASPARSRPRRGAAAS
ncbi:MAG TPA: hypothetical protein VHT52_17845 [Stellaceae bacterium]|jgi:hypothetical protein|nr:hypothetical protein [Stellaceae bacterium]